MINEAGQIVLSSPAVSELFGYHPEELVGEAIEISFPPSTIPATPIIFVASSRHPAHARWETVSTSRSPS